MKKIFILGIFILSLASSVFAEDAIKIEFEDYMAGGEGVGYHDTFVGPDNDTYIDRGDDVDVGNSDSGLVVGAFSGEWLRYEITVPESGDYIMSISHAAPSANNTTISVYPQNGKPVSKTISGTGTWWNQIETEFAVISLAKGSQVLKICIDDAAHNLNYFTLKPHTEYMDIVAKVNSLSNHESIYSVLLENRALFGDIWSQTEKLFYPQMAMRHLAGKSFSCFEELKIALKAALEYEHANPTVRLMNTSGTDIFEYNDGRMRAKIDASVFSKAVTNIYAIYEDDRLVYLNRVENGIAARTFNIKDFTYDSTKTYTTKVLFWEDMCIPANYYKAVLFDKDLYVNPCGNDNNDGSILYPVATIERSRELAGAYSANGQNVTVNISGEYKITEPIAFTTENSAANGTTITYKGDETAVINGGEQIAGWEQYDTNIYRAHTELADIRQLWVDGARMQRAKSGIISPSEYWDDAEDETWEADGYQFTHKKYLVGDWSNIAVKTSLAGEENAEVVWEHLWRRQRIPVEAVTYKTASSNFSTDGTLTIKLKQPYFYNMLSCPNMPDGDEKFYIENAFAYLDEEGEFYFDKKNGYIYYYTVNGAPENAYVGVSEGYMSFLGTESRRISGITVEGIEFKYGTWLEPNETGLVHDQADMLITSPNQVATMADRGEHLFAQIEISWADNVNIQNNKMYHTGSTAIGLRDGVVNSSVSGNYIEDTSGAAIMVGSWRTHNVTAFTEMLTRNITVSDNIIRDVAVEYAGSVGIGTYYVQNVTITHNDIEGAAYSGISLGWGWGGHTGDNHFGNSITGNRVVDVLKVANDGAHIYTLGNMPDCVISGNYCSLESNDGNGGGGIYLDQGSANITIENNVVEDCKYWVFGWNNSAHDIILRNNWTDTEGSLKEIVNLTDENNTVCPDGWPSAATTIINNAGARK